MPRAESTCSIEWCSKPLFCTSLCSMHYARKRKGQDMNATPRFGYLRRRTEDKIGEVDDNGCWPWVGRLQVDGYATISHELKEVRVHRLTYEWHKGVIPDGLVIDHLCRVRHCVNPDHLDAVTAYENFLRGDAPAAKNARKTHCKNGHPLSGSNLVMDCVRPGRPRRTCRSCGF